MTRSMEFAEAMSGTWRPAGGVDRALRFDVSVRMDGLLRPFGTATGRLQGVVNADGLARRAPLTGTIEVSPVERRRIRYTFDFTGDDGHPYRFDGWKSINWLRPLSTWTTLPATILDRRGAAVGTAITRFPLRETPGLVRSVRFPAVPDLHARRWKGTRGRLEVWYDTLTDPTTGTGLWLHHELVAPVDGTAAFCHGWVALFPPDAAPRWERFGPDPVVEPDGFRSGPVVADSRRRCGEAGDARWDLHVDSSDAPLFTFPLTTWGWDLLPGCQIVPEPRARYTGTVTFGSRSLQLDRVVGASARVRGHGNAERWGWLHADLGDGDVLEVVAAVPRHHRLRRLRPLPVLRLRVDGRDWPAQNLLAAARFRADLSLPTWTVSGTWRGTPLRVTVTQPPERCVAVPYTDPDGGTATCTNTERADVRVEFGDRTWELDASGHAEIGTRP